MLLGRTYLTPAPPREVNSDKSKLVLTSFWTSEFRKVMSRLPGATNTAKTLVFSPFESTNQRRLRLVYLLIAKQKFTMVGELDTSEEYVSERLSIALLAGTLPIYFGNAPWSLLEQYLPHRKSIVRAADFVNSTDLMLHIHRLDANESAYNEYFEWKSHPLPAAFTQKMSECVFTAQNAICKVRGVLRSCNGFVLSHPHVFKCVNKQVFLFFILSLPLPHSILILFDIHVLNDFIYFI